MLEWMRKKFEDQNKDNDFKSISLDFKLMFIYHIVMIVLFGSRFFDNAKDQVSLALILVVVLGLISVVHKIKANWKWPGLNILSIPAALFNLVFIYIFLAFASYSMGPGVEAVSFNNALYVDLLVESWFVIIKAASIPVYTPWYLAAAGIGMFNILTALKLAIVKKSEFEAQCINKDTWSDNDLL